MRLIVQWLRKMLFVMEEGLCGAWGEDSNDTLWISLLRLLIRLSHLLSTSLTIRISLSLSTSIHFTLPSRMQTPSVSANYIPPGESSVPLIVDTFMFDSMAREASLIHSDLLEKVISMTGSAEDWQCEEEVTADSTDGQTTACPCPGLWITSRPLRLD